MGIIMHEGRWFFQRLGGKCGRRGRTELSDGISKRLPRMSKRLYQQCVSRVLRFAEMQ